MLNYKDWNIEAMTGYKPKTTYYMDFSIADGFGVEAIKDTYNRAKKACIDGLGIEYLTELVMVLNWKIYEHFERNNVFARLYNELWQELDNYCCENLEGDELNYYFRTTD